MPGKFNSGKSGFKECFDDVSNCKRAGKSTPVNCRQHTRVCSFLLLDIGLFGHDPNHQNFYKSRNPKASKFHKFRILSVMNM